MTLSEVAMRSGLTRASARRFLLTLCDLGYAAFDGKTYRLQPKTLELGYAYLSSQSVVDLTRPHMERLVNELGETCSLSVLSGGSAVILARLMPEGRLLQVSLSVGSRLPLTTSAMGRVLLAGLPDGAYALEADAAGLPAGTPARKRLDLIRRKARAAGHVVVDQEFAPGVRSVAIPVRDVEGCIVAAISVCADSARTADGDFPRRFVESLTRTSGELVVPRGALA